MKDLGYASITLDCLKLTALQSYLHSIRRNATADTGLHDTAPAHQIQHAAMRQPAAGTQAQPPALHQPCGRRCPCPLHTLLTNLPLAQNPAHADITAACCARAAAVLMRLRHGCASAGCRLHGGGRTLIGRLDFRALRSTRGRRRRCTVVRAGARSGTSVARGTVLPASNWFKCL